MNDFIERFYRTAPPEFPNTCRHFQDGGKPYSVQKPCKGNGGKCARKECPLFGLPVLQGDCQPGKRTCWDEPQAE